MHRYELYVYEDVYEASCEVNLPTTDRITITVHQLCQLGICSCWRPYKPASIVDIHCSSEFGSLTAVNYMPTLIAGIISISIVARISFSSTLTHFSSANEWRYQNLGIYVAIGSTGRRDVMLLCRCSMHIKEVSSMP